MKTILTAIILILFLIQTGNCQTNSKEFPVLRGPYLGQKPPGMTPELFAPGLVSIGEGVHGNIVFTTDFTEAAWHPNFKVNGKGHMAYWVSAKIIEELRPKQ